MDFKAFHKDVQTFYHGLSAHANSREYVIFARFRTRIATCYPFHQAEAPSIRTSITSCFLRK